jgi:molecular chaperone GrpE (heat shock protein)
MERDRSTEGISTEERERILRGFEAWLDRALTDESAPQGLTAELLTALQNGDPFPPLEAGQPGAGGCDLYSLWSAMTALTQEVRIQGRTFKQLHETLLNETLPQIALSLEASAAAAAGRSVEDAPLEQGSARTQQPRKQEIDVLLDLRDRIERGGNTVRTAAEELASTRLPSLARWLGVGNSYARHTQEVLAALSHGYSLTLDSLDEALVACRVSRVAAEGRIFDPQRMTAVDIEETESVPEGTVVEVYRNGFEWNNEVYRTAQVKVARATR